MFGRSKAPTAVQVRQEIQSRQTTQALGLLQWFELNLSTPLDQAIDLYRRGVPWEPRFWHKFSDYRTGQGYACDEHGTLYNAGYQYAAGYTVIQRLSRPEIPRLRVPAAGVDKTCASSFPALLAWTTQRYEPLGYRIRTYAGKPGMREEFDWEKRHNSLHLQGGWLEELLISVTAD